MGSIFEINDIEFETERLDSINDADKEDDYSRGELMEHLLLRTYTKEDGSAAFYEEDEWIALWEEYVRLEKMYKEPLSLNKKLNLIGLPVALENLNLLQKRAPDLYQKVTNESFRAQFLCEAAFAIEGQKVFGRKSPNSPRQKKLAIQKILKYVRDAKWEAVSPEVFWETYYRNLHWNDEDTEYTYMLLWKKCFGNLLIIDMIDGDQRACISPLICGGIDLFLEDEWEFYEVSNSIKEFLRFIDGMKGMDEKEAEPYVRTILESEDKELLYLALCKNMIPVEWVKKGITLLMERGYLEGIPLLLLKQYGEWPAKIEEMGKNGGKDETAYED